jgi:hypothetical protein
MTRVLTRVHTFGSRKKLVAAVNLNPRECIYRGSLSCLKKQELLVTMCFCTYVTHASLVTGQRPNAKIFATQENPDDVMVVSTRKIPKNTIILVETTQAPSFEVFALFFDLAVWRFVQSRGHISYMDLDQNSYIQGLMFACIPEGWIEILCQTIPLRVNGVDQTDDLCPLLPSEEEKVYVPNPAFQPIWDMYNTSHQLCLTM